MMNISCSFLNNIYHNNINIMLTIEKSKIRKRQVFYRIDKKI